MKTVITKSLLALALWGMGSMGAWAQNRPSYINREWDGTKVVSKTTNPPMDVIQITESKSGETMWLEKGKWYFISGTVERKRLIVPHDATEYAENPVHIILGDGAVLKSVITFRGYFPGLHHEDEIKTGILHIHAQSDGANMGKLIANASASGDGSRNITDCAGIGGTDEDNSTFDYIALNEGYDSHHCGRLYIHGGDIYAKGNKYAAGIGGGDAGNGGDITIYGGKVETDGGIDAAGIGGGEDGNGGKLYVYGGSVYADGTGWGAGIGGGEDGDGAEVKIYGGSVTAWAGDDAGKKSGCAIGSEDGDGHRGSLYIGDKMMVHAGQNPADANSHLFTTGERVPACYFRPYTKVEVCPHAKGSYTINGTGENDTHTLKCPNCLDRSTTKHTFGDGGACTVCGAKGTAFTVSVYLPNTSATDGTYVETQTLTMASGSTLTLPVPPAEYDPAGMEFDGWLQTTSAPSTASWAKQNGETLLDAGSNITISTTTHLIARYKAISLTLQDAADNSETIGKYNGKTIASVTFSGRTFFKDNKWNTLILPFDVKTFTGTPLEGAEIRMFDSDNCSFDASTGQLTINFTTKTDDGIKAGYPFLVKWASDNNIVNPVFNNVKIDQSAYETSSKWVDFVGTYSPEVIYRGTRGEEGGTITDVDMTYLYLGGDNTLYYPSSADFKVNAFRAYFRLKNGLTAGTPGSNARIILNFGDEATGITDTEANSSFFTPHPSFSEGWHTLDGRRLSGKPAARGMYIHNGKKVIVK